MIQPLGEDRITVSVLKDTKNLRYQRFGIWQKY